MASTLLKSPDIVVVYEDDDLVVVNKPSGLLCVPGLKEPDNLFDRVKSHYPNARVVHRLDMSTSGLVIFALNHPTQKALGKCFENKQVYKQYIAVVNGEMPSVRGEVVAPLICDWERRPIQKVDWHNGKIAHTAYTVISSMQEKTVLKLSPITGRTHQLRLHMLHIGHPILGDKLYNVNNSHTKAERLLLHAWQLKFVHPKSNEEVFLTCAPSFEADLSEA